METRKAKYQEEPEKLKVDDNILVRDSHIKSIPTKIQRLLHSRTFGKEPGRDQGQPWSHNQGTLHRDIKKIPMTEKVCKLYEEEQVGKTREGRKAVPTNKNARPRMGT